MSSCEQDVSEMQDARCKISHEIEDEWNGMDGLSDMQKKSK